MASTSIPKDLLEHRDRGMALTGLRGDDWGIAPDQRHKSGGGYHCGQQDNQDIDKYHPPASANVGSTTEDYSVRQRRDRGLGGNIASAEDIGDNWPHGGRTAWLKFNRLLVAQMQANDPKLRALRAVNFSPDGTLRKRYDSLHPEAGIINSTDNVDIHTHLEFWRDTVGTPGRAVTLSQIERIIQAAITGAPLDATEEDDEEMGQTLTGTVPDYMETGDGEAIGYTIAPGIIEGGIANARPGWVNFIGDGYGEKFAARIMITNGVKDEHGAVVWTGIGPKGEEEFVWASGERLNFSLKPGTTGISFLHRAIQDGKPVPASLSKSVFPNPHRIGWSIELGAVKR